MRGSAGVRPWLIALLVVGALAVPTAAQYGGGDGSPVGESNSEDTEANGTEEREQREATPAGDEGGGNDLRPLWYFLGALALVGIAIGVVVMLRER